MFNKDLEMVLLFVENPILSVEFYKQLFDIEPVEQSSTFALFVLGNGVKLGLWSVDDSDPKVCVGAGAMEIAFLSDDVDDQYEKWMDLGVVSLQEPTDMDFGRSFVVLDPDCHRIRIYKYN